MSDDCFAQYLLNEGVVLANEVGALLGKAMGAEPTLQLLAFRQGDLDSGQMGDLAGLGKEEFLSAARTKGYLAESAIERLQGAVPGQDLRFAQALLETQRLDYPKLADLFSCYDRLAVHPVRTAVEKAATSRLVGEVEVYSAYTEVFLQSLDRLLGLPAVATGHDVVLSADKSYIVSQRISGDANLVGGIWAEEKVFAKLAGLYSHEDMASVDDLAIDSLTEFLNVMTGLFAVEYAKHGLELDLEMPRFMSNVLPEASRQLDLDMETGIGSFHLLLATDEFIEQ